MLTGGISQRAEAAKYAAIVIEEDSGKVLFSRSADSLRYPASLTKIMTLYLVFEELASGRLEMDSRMKVSRLAAGRSHRNSISRLASQSLWKTPSVR